MNGFICISYRFSVFLSGVNLDTLLKVIRIPTHLV